MYLNHCYDAKNILTAIRNEHLCISYSQFGEDRVLWNIFETWKCLDGGFYIDVGAYHPFHYSNTFLFHSMKKWRGINIDANPDAIRLFNLHRPSDININAAVSSESKEVKFTIYNEPAASTFDSVMKERHINNPHLKIASEVTILTKPLSEILQNISLPQEITLLSVDAEGFDLEVLKSNDWSKIKPRFIAIEDHAMNLGDLSNNMIYHYLFGKGYRLMTHVFVTSIYCLR